MKKLFLILLFSFLMFSCFSVKATDFEDSIAGIGVTSSDFSIIDGHIDLLVPKNEFENQINSEINPNFINDFPNYENFDYLDDTEWISYYAFVKDANCRCLPNQNLYEFATSKDEYLRLNDIKFIHVDSEGNTVAISDIYKVPNPLFFQDFNRLNRYNRETGTFSSDMNLKFDEVFVFIFLGTLFFAFVLAVFRFIVAEILKLNTINNIWFISYYMLIYMIILITGFLLLNRVDFIQRLVANIFSLIIYILTLSMLESGVSYYLIFRGIEKKKYLKFTLISYGIILAIIIFFTLVL